MILILFIFTVMCAFAMEVPYEDYQNELNSTLYEEDFIPQPLLSDEGDPFTYTAGDEFGPSNWWKFSQNCVGLNQSPINLEYEQAIVRRSSTIRLSYFTKSVQSVVLTNTGYTVAMKFNFADTRENSYVFGGQTYIFDSAHLHWGSSCTGGSEHTLNGHRFAAEIHLVHYNKRYGTLANAVLQPDGLSVIGVFMALSDPTVLTGQADNRFIPELNRIVEVGSSYTMPTPGFTIRELIRTEVKSYFTYRGSLTTPPCNPVVQWIVSTDFIRIFPDELAELNTLLGPGGDPITINYRPLQNLGSRVVNINA